LRWFAFVSNDWLKVVRVIVVRSDAHALLGFQPCSTADRELRTFSETPATASFETNRPTCAECHVRP
jgi:hypothetical protein